MAVRDDETGMETDVDPTTVSRTSAVGVETESELKDVEVKIDGDGEAGKKRDGTIRLVTEIEPEFEAGPKPEFELLGGVSLDRGMESVTDDEDEGALVIILEAELVCASAVAGALIIEFVAANNINSAELEP